MPKFVQVGNSIINLEMMTDARYLPKLEDGQGPQGSLLTIRFAAPQPASVGAGDWATEAHEVTFKDKDADGLWEFLQMSADLIIPAAKGMAEARS